MAVSEGGFLQGSWYNLPFNALYFFEEIRKCRRGWRPDYSHPKLPPTLLRKKVHTSSGVGGLLRLLKLEYGGEECSKPCYFVVLPKTKVDLRAFFLPATEFVHAPNSEFSDAE